MAEREIQEMLCAFAAGAMDRTNYIQFKEYISSGKELPYGELGELQNIMALIPVILEIEEPKARLKDEVAKKLLSHQNEIKEKLNREKKKTGSTSENENAPLPKVTKPEIKNATRVEYKPPVADEAPIPDNDFSPPDLEEAIEPALPETSVPVFSENDFIITEPGEADTDFLHDFEDDKLDFPGPSDLDLLEEEEPLMHEEPPKPQINFDSFGEDELKKPPPPKVEKPKKHDSEFHFEESGSDAKIIPIERPIRKEPNEEAFTRPVVRELQFSGRQTVEDSKPESKTVKPKIEKKRTDDILKGTNTNLYNPFETGEKSRVPRIPVENKPVIPGETTQDTELKITNVPGRRKIQDYQPQEFQAGFQSSFKGKTKKSTYEGGGASKWIIIFLLIITLVLIGGGVYLFTANLELNNEINSLKYEISSTHNDAANYATMMKFLENKDVMVSNLSGSELAQNASGNLFISPGTKSALLRIKNLPPIESGQELQIWLIVRGESLSLGMIEKNVSGEYFQTLKYNFEPEASIDLVRVTSEPSGGSTAPTGKTYLYGEVR